MKIDRTFYIECSRDGKCRFYNVGEKFFRYADVVSAVDNNSGLIKCFSPNEEKEKRDLRHKLKKEGWLELKYDDIKLIKVNKHGCISVYPFPYREGYVSIAELEQFALEKQYNWDYADHATNPFSALQDYRYFLYNICMTNISNGTKYDTTKFQTLVDEFDERIKNIGAIREVEDFFTKKNLVPNPQRFDSDYEQLSSLYHSHLDEYAGIRCLEFIDKNYYWDSFISDLQEIEALHKLVNDKWYEIQEQKLKSSNQSNLNSISSDPYN